MSSHGAGTRAQSQVVYAAALVQGIVLVTFPAASTIFTSASSYGLSSSQYGAMFLPQAITAVGSSLLQGKLSQRLGGKPVETMNGNWSQLDLTSLKLSATVASAALTVFWAMVTAGRLLFAVIQRWFPSRLAYHLLPFVLAGAFVLISLLPSRAPVPGILAFALAGFGCSALLPLTISFGQERLATMSAAMAGLVIAFYEVGYGIAAFGVGPLRRAGLTLPSLYGVSAVVAVALGVLSLAVAHGRPSPRSGHPRPQPLDKPRFAPELIS